MTTGRHSPPHEDERRPVFGYRLLVRLLSPALFGWALHVAVDIFYRKGGPKAFAGRGPALDFLRQRLGHAPRAKRPCTQPGSQQRHLWLHAASVGEVLTALPLIDEVARRARTRLLVTTATPTGAAVLAGRAPANVRHRYLPLDLPRAVARFLDDERPDSGWIVETEIWPWLFATAAARQVPLTLISARLSARSLDGPARALAPAYAEALRDVRILARSEADAQRFCKLAPRARSIECVGDLKRVPRALPATVQSPLEQSFCLAASTHEGEEIALAQAWLASSANGLLVIAPRHPDRGNAIAQDLQRLPGQRAAVPRRSLDQLPAEHDRLYLADTLGELDRFYAHATAVFVGGSLIARGGHNLLEPARHGVPICTGPHTANFVESVAELMAADALVVLQDAVAVVDWYRRTSESGDRSAGRRAAEVAQRDASLLDRYLAALSESGPSS